MVARRPLPWQVPIHLAFVLAAAFGPSAAAGAAPAGAIRGTILDKDFGVPLGGVRVLVLEAHLAAFSTGEGQFVIDGVPAGAYTLSFTKDGYEREVQTQVQVSAGRLAELRVEMSSEVVEMDEMVVTGTDLPIEGELGLLEIRATAVAVQDALSADLISKSGVGDAAGALKMVVGASVAAGKYATVRGLSDRYTGTTLNGVRLPSADPRRRAVPMDLFPAGTIESVTVTKTFTPDLQGDFTGGGVDIKTRSVPDDRLLSVTESAGYNGLATRNPDALTYVGGGVDSFGHDTGGRALPDGADDDLPQFPSFRNPKPADVEASRTYDELVRSFDPVIGVSRRGPGANYGFSLLTGRRLQLEGGRSLGLMGAMTYARKHDFYDNGVNNSAVVSTSDQPISVNRPREDSRGNDELLIGGLANVELGLGPRDQVALRLVLNQSAEDEARLQVQKTGSRSVEQNQSLHYTERTVGSTQLHGTHTVSALRDLLVDWTAAANVTKQDEPDVRFFRNVFSHDTLGAEMPKNSTDAQNTRRIFRDIEENDYQLGVNATLPLELGNGLDARVKTGLFVESSDRGYEQRSFTYTFPAQVGSFRDPIVVANNAKARFQARSRDELWTDVFLNSGRIGQAALTTKVSPNQLLWSILPLGTDVDYAGDQEIQAFYAMAELPVTDRLRVTAGARYETTRLAIDPANEAFGKVPVIIVQPNGDRALDPNVPQEEARADIEDQALLPSVSLVWEVIPDMNIRASWARTIARPTFRELAPVATEEFIFGDEFFGNPTLTVSRVANYDLRWEWFPRQGEVLAVSGFYKELRDPIELISFTVQDRAFVQPVNFDKGRVMGLEVEARAPLGRFAEALRDFTAGLNLTLIDSEVDIPREERDSLDDFGMDEATRRLQGQPDRLFNVNLSYEGRRTGTSASLFYSLVGSTLVTGAARGAGDGNPSVFESPVRTLDLKITQRLNDMYDLSFRAENLTRGDRRSVYEAPGRDGVVKSSRESPAVFALALSVKL